MALPQAGLRLPRHRRRGDPRRGPRPREVPQPFCKDRLVARRADPGPESPRRSRGCRPGTATRRSSSRIRSSSRKLGILPRVDGRPTAMFAGRLVFFKGTELAIRAVAATEDWHLEIYGSGSDERRLRKLTARLGVEDRVHFQGFMGRESSSSGCAPMQTSSSFRAFTTMRPGRSPRRSPVGCRSSASIAADRPLSPATPRSSSRRATSNDGARARDALSTAVTRHARRHFCGPAPLRAKPTSKG